MMIVLCRMMSDGNLLHIDVYCYDGKLEMSKRCHHLAIID